jgi:ATP-dependent exoDNAse (exonuclease V) beta subunit
LAAIRPGIQAALRELGVSPSELDQAVSRVQSALSATLGDARGRWILSRHEDARSEFELGGTLDGSVYRVTIDRIFLDENGVRWIVDYKTGSPGDEPVEEFLDAEQARYSGQLEVYARLWQRIENRTVRLALYFPSFGGWREWPAGADYSLSTRLDTSADTTP